MLVSSPESIETASSFSCRIEDPRFKRQGPSFQNVYCSVAIFTLLACMSGISLSAAEPPAEKSDTALVPAWLFPISAPPSDNSPPLDEVSPIHLSGSDVTFTEAELSDLFKATDWHPHSHSTMPPIVSMGRAPDVCACGFCHTAGGQGRPENAALAGLPAAYILSQLADFRSGARRSAASGPYRPVDRMINAVMKATDEELSAAATYFAAQTMRTRVVVVERESVPRSHVIGWVYAADHDKRSEPLGQRLLEFAPDPIRHEHRDDEMRYIAYVPVGSIERGKHIAQAGIDSPANACSVCHGPGLRGVGAVPPIAGRSPTYILRQLFAFKTGARSGSTGVPMRNVVMNMKIGHMIDAAAYAASLAP